MENFKRQNKSSIIRIVISKFNDTGIKEFKVLYNKQGGVDTFSCETKKVNDNKEILFMCIKKHPRDFGDDFACNISEDKKSVEIIKTVNGRETRRYRVEISLNQKNEKEVELKVIDLLENNSEKRKAEGSTKRLLLDEGLMKKYAEIAFGKKECWEDIDSQKIYKIKRFLDYRSNMLIYFQFINDFLTKGINIKKNGDIKQAEIWEFIKDYEEDKSTPNKEIFDKDNRLNKVTENIKKYLNEGITNYNNRKLRELEKLCIIKKKKVSDYEKKKVCIESFDNNLLKSDMEKLVRVFMTFRHKLMHYNYSFFEELFDNGNPAIEYEADIKKPLNKELDLNMFRDLSKLKEFKEENKTNYLKDTDVFRILGKERNAKKLYTAYNIICNRQNGFNSFINSFFVTDGEENIEFKNLIENHFNKKIELLQNAYDTGKINDKTLEKKEFEEIEKELNEKKTIKSLIGKPYEWDIHQSKEYKILYNKRKILISDLNNLINKGKNKDTRNEITKTNAKLLELKQKMEDITKLNSKVRLEYRLRVAFSFLIINYNKPCQIRTSKGNVDGIGIDVYGFKSNFDPSKLNEIKELKENPLRYLEAGRKSFEEDKPISLNLGEIERDIGKADNFLTNKEENNLSKFYIIMYLLLPNEIRGDFLGFVKNHYYDIKNIDFVDIDKKDTNTKEDIFFHNIRLFEKNTKDFEVIRYGIVDYSNLRSDFDKIYEKFGLDLEKTKYLQNENRNEEDKRQIGLFDKNLIQPIMKYYQFIFKFLNDIEIHALFNLLEENNVTLKQCIEIVKEDKELNFSNLLTKVNFGLYLPLNDDKSTRDYYNSKTNLNFGRKKVGSIISNYKGFYNLRNKIAHLNYKELFINYILNGVNVNTELEDIISEIKRVNLHEEILGYSFLNDFYMKKEKFIFNQRLLEDKGTTSPNEEEDKKRIIGILRANDLANFNEEDYKEKELYLSPEILDKILSRSKELMQTVNNKDLSTQIQSKTKNLQVILKKGKKYLIKEIRHINEEDKTKILGRIALESSSLLGIYKKYIIKDIKQKLIALFTKGERRYLTLELYNKTRYNEEYFKRTGGRFLNKNDEKEKEEDKKIREDLRELFKDTLTSEAKIGFEEKSKDEWNNDFKANYGFDSVITDNLHILEDDLKNMYDEKTQMFTYKTDYVLKDPDEKLKKHKPIHVRNIFHGVLRKEQKEGSEEDKKKDEYLGLYKQKIKSLY